ncbi:apolipoprotein N-acyltransferase [Miniimonas sp. S16]|uniref:apolipoprotein N-acyltransferase n=1 Tax=Miniimonas sp. S16 TaxID=2171623 RepID=UPI001F47BA6A|nr:apolipoprotein N-acyltransferase [Miniimonas sp. S16]
MPPTSEPSRLLTLLLAVIGGLVTDAAFPQRSVWPLAILGVALLALALRRESARWGFVVGTVWGLSFFLVHIWWANEAVGVVPWVALSSAEAMMVGAFGAAWVWIRRWPPVRDRAVLAVPAFAIAWVAIEALRSAWPFGGFPWGRLAFSQTTGPLLRLASLGGTPLVSGLVAALGLTLAIGWWSLRRGMPGRGAVVLGVLVAVPLVSLAVPLDSRPEQGTTTVGIVQGNVSEPGLGAFDNAREVIGNHVAGTMELAQDHAGELDVVLWPENAADYDPRTDAQAAAEIDGAAQAVQAPILLGTQSYTFGADGKADARYNDYLRWDPGVGPVAVYAKQHPAPFAEYIPLRDVVRRFSSAVDLVTVDMKPGTGVGILPVDVDGRSVPFGIAICFEVAYDQIVADSVDAGAEVLVVPTNNASFGETPESEQQLAMSVFRAVEHGRAVVQVSTVGVSGVITPNGVVTQRTELFTAAAATAELPLRTSLTPATTLAPVLTWLAYGGAVLLVLIGVVTHPRRRSRTASGRTTSGRTTSGRTTSGRTTGGRNERGARVRARAEGDVRV